MKNNGDLVQFIKTKDYEMVNNNLGAGSFGKTVLLRDPFIDELFVAKKYEPEYETIREKFYESFLSEIKILYKMNHKNIVRVYNYYAYESIFTGYILMEYIEGTNIADYFEDYIWSHTASLDELFVQLIDAFCYLEQKNIVHRDIREGNILITKDGCVKVIDFGLGKIYEPIEPPKDEDSLRSYINRQGLDLLPREYFEGKYTSKTDMFYLAEMINRLLRENYLSDSFSNHAILDKMMKENPDERYTSFSEIKKEINAKNLSVLQISKTDKQIYQNFADALYSITQQFNEKPRFVTDRDRLINNLKSVATENFFSNIIQNNGHLIAAVTHSPLTYITNRKVDCSVLTKFIELFEKCSPETQDVLIKNLDAKLSTIHYEEPFEPPF